MKRERVKLRILGNKIKNLRANKGLTQEKFADKMDISIDTVKNWEQGYNYPSIDALIQIADYFECDFDYLLGKQENPNKIYSHISEYTGISETSAVFLVSACKNKEPIIDIISELLDERDVLYQIYSCASANYGSVGTFVDIHDPFMPKHFRPTLITPQKIRQADSMELYSKLCEFIDVQRKKNGLPTSKDM